MDAKARRGRVCMEGVVAGILEQTPTGSRFTYDIDYLRLTAARPVSWTMPLRQEPYESVGLHPFFENLLPEGWLLEIAVSKLKLSRADAFGLLLALCADCVGAVEIYPERSA